MPESSRHLDYLTTLRPETRRSLAFLAPSAYPLGGVADWLDYVMIGLTDRGCKCQLLLVKGTGHDVERYLGRHPWPDVQIVSNETGSREGRIRGLLSAIDRSEADLVVSINLVDAYEAIRRKRTRDRFSPKVVMALHGLESSLVEDIRREKDVLDGVIATNRLSAAIASDEMDSQERVHYAPYGVPVSTPVREFKATGQQLRLLYAGRIEQEQKRVLDLPKIVHAVRSKGIDATLSIAGGGPVESRLREEFDRVKVANAIIWLGDLNSQALAQAYRSHDALIITSEWETGPIVAWEAMSFGLPVVSSRYIGHGLEGALVDGLTALLFDIGAVDGAVQSLLRLQNSSMRRALSENGLELVRHRYSRDASVAAWHDAICRVVSAPALRAGPPRRSTPSGRLDRWVGVSRAEDLRRLLGIAFVPDSPGSAWPHTGSTSSRQSEFLQHARELDSTSTPRISEDVLAIVSNKT